MSDAVSEGGQRSQTRGFLFSDLRGYSAFTDAHGDAAARELLGRYRAAVRGVIAKFGGAEIRTEGDSFYVVFTSVGDAVEAGLAIVAAGEATAADPSAHPVMIGVGVHAGETVDSAEGIVSSAVNTAARICAIAGPGEVLVSDTVRALTRTHLEVEFVARGRRRLKGIVEPVSLYRVQSPGAAAIHVGRGRLAGWRTKAAAIGGALVLVVIATVIGAAFLREGLGRDIPSGSDAANESADPEASAGGSDGTASTQGRIAFTRADESGTAVWVIHPDGSGETRLSADASNDAHPSWSPDCAQLAISREYGISVIDADGGNPRQIVSVDVDAGEAAEFPAWSPTGDLIAYSVSTTEFVGDEGGTMTGIVVESRIWTVRPDGTDARAATDPGLLFDSRPAWSPEGALLIFARSSSGFGGDGDIYALDIASGELTQMTSTGTETHTGTDATPRWSPLGELIAFTRMTDEGSADIFTVRPDGTGLTNLTNHEAHDFDPVWSPDGTSILFESTRDFGYDIYRMNVDGTGAMPLIIGDSYEGIPAWCDNDLP